MLEKCKGVIFDMDGLLFDTEKVFQETWQELAKEQGIVLKDGFVRAVSGTSGQKMCRVIEEYYGVWDGTDIMNECMQRICRKLETSIEKKVGVDEILKFFYDHRIRIAVASSSSRIQIEKNLKKAGIRGYFTEIVSGKDVKNGKPSPDIFVLAAERIHCIPGQCYVFEDSENGIRAGFAAGCKTIMIPDLLEPSSEVQSMCCGIYKDLKQALDMIKVVYH